MKIPNPLPLLISLILAGSSLASLADDKPRTIAGDGCCAKCALKEKDACQNAIKVKDGDKTVTYYLVQNAVSKAFHKNLCSGSDKVKATGTVKEVDGQYEFTATRIEIDK